MEIFVLHILKLNIIAAVIILLVKLLAILFKGISEMEVYYLAADYGKSLYSCAPSGKFYAGGF